MFVAGLTVLLAIGIAISLFDTLRDWPKKEDDES